LRLSYLSQSCCGGNGDAFCAASDSLDFDVLSGTKSTTDKLPTDFQGVEVESNGVKYGQCLTASLFGSQYFTKIMARPVGIMINGTRRGPGYDDSHPTMDITALDFKVYKPGKLSSFDSVKKAAVYSRTIAEPEDFAPEWYVEKIAAMTKKKMMAMMGTQLDWDGSGFPKITEMESVYHFFPEASATDSLNIMGIVPGSWGSMAATIGYNMYGPRGAKMLQFMCRPPSPAPTNANFFTHNMSWAMNCPRWSMRMTPNSEERKYSSPASAKHQAYNGIQSEPIHTSYFMTDFRPMFNSTWVVSFDADSMSTVMTGEEKKGGHSMPLLYKTMNADGSVREAWFASNEPTKEKYGTVHTTITNIKFDAAGGSMTLQMTQYGEFNQQIANMYLGKMTQMASMVRPPFFISPDFHVSPEGDKITMPSMHFFEAAKMTEGGEQSSDDSGASGSGASSDTGSGYTSWSGSGN